MNDDILMIAILIILIIILIAYIAYIKYYEYSPNYNIISNTTYLDNNATTIPSQDTLKTVVDNSCLGNASASSSDKAKQVIEHAVQTIKEWTYRDAEVIWTSGASESNNQILRSVPANGHIVLSAIEHKTSLDCAESLKENNISYTLVYPVNGRIQTQDVLNAIRQNTVLVSIMSANNETGVINDIKSIFGTIKSMNNNIICHSDIVQSFGKYRFPLDIMNCDFASVSFHKVYGPTGVGAIILRPEAASFLKPMINGSQNHHLRGGTLNVSGIAGAAKALRMTTLDRDNKNKNLLNLKNYLLGKLANKYQILNQNMFVGKEDLFGLDGTSSNMAIVPIQSDNDLPNTLMFSIVKYGPMSDHFCNIKLRDYMAKKNVIISIGSACNSTNAKPNHVLVAMKLPFIIRCGIVRVSFGDYNSYRDCDKFMQIFNEVLPMCHI